VALALMGNSKLLSKLSRINLDFIANLIPIDLGKYQPIFILVQFPEKKLMNLVTL